MLATVTERTREIGVRRALGATRDDIIQQFLIETVVLTASGGLLGVLFGLSVGPIFRGMRTGLTMVSPDLLPPIVQSLEPRIAMWSVLLSLFISLGVGVLFGVYPARQAAHMDPIEAFASRVACRAFASGNWQLVVSFRDVGRDAFCSDDDSCFWSDPCVCDTLPACCWH